MPMTWRPCKECKRMNKLCEHYKATTEWITVAERLPPRVASYGVSVLRCWSHDVLVFNSAGRIRIDAYCHSEQGGFWNKHRGEGVAKVTHWMPLPKEPRDGAR